MEVKVIFKILTVVNRCIDLAEIYLKIISEKGKIIEEVNRDISEKTK